MNSSCAGLISAPRTSPRARESGRAFKVERVKEMVGLHVACRTRFRKARAWTAELCEGEAAVFEAGLVRVAHAALDAVSVLRLFRGVRGGPVDRGDLAVWQRRWVSSDQGRQAIGRRVVRLEAFGAQLRPRLRPLPLAKLSMRPVGRSILARVDQEAARAGVTRMDWLTTLLAVWLKKAFDTKLVIALQQRNSRLCPDLVGRLTDNLLVCVDLRATQALQEVAQRVHREIREAEADFAPSLEVEKAFGAGQGVRQVIFNYQSHSPDVELLGEDLHLESRRLLQMPSHVVLRVDLVELNDGATLLMQSGHEELPMDDLLLLLQSEATQRVAGLVGCQLVESSVREAVAAALPMPEALEDDVPLRCLGLDSVSSMFLKGQLSELLGVLPGLLDPESSTMKELAALKAQRGGAERIQTRMAREADWLELREIWMHHHHLIEMVGETSRVVLTGPPAWFAFFAALRGLHSLTGAPNIWLKAAFGYALLAVLQHGLHWLIARSILAYDLRWGELTHQGCRTTVLVVQGPSQLLGVACLRQRGRVASLWHAAVVPAARNSGAAQALLASAEEVAASWGATRIEAVCLSVAAKAACHNAAMSLWNSTGRWPLVPAFFSKRLRPKRGTN